jgi:probable phosphoglycerate mutase
MEGTSGEVLPWLSPVARGELAVTLVRHGQTAWNVERRFLGSSDIPLNPVGVAQAEALGRWLPQPFDHVYCSPLSRAYATARALDPRPSPVPALQEMAQGEIEGLSREEANERFPGLFERWLDDPVHLAIPGGESLLGCRDRALTGLRTIVSAHRPGQSIAVVTHQMVIASVTCTIAGGALQRWREHGVTNGAMTVLSWDGIRFAVVAQGWRPRQLIEQGTG